MKKYEVVLIETVNYTVEVEADSQEEAERLADLAFCHSDDPNQDFNGTFMDREVSSAHEVPPTPAPGQQLYRVNYHQFAEEVGTVEVVATSPEEALELAKASEDDIDWSDGDDIRDLEPYSVQTEAGDTVWEP